ncbi:hypothetical protein [Microbacterium sp. dk485]|uniref:ABC transporter permease n=1 Tax=Microbacterium sp. dk485 TaxID=2560021 RepID=UPI001ADD98B5|nr:hypothetical protein [Microbacterium sp. dk485]
MTSETVARTRPMGQTPIWVSATAGTGHLLRFLLRRDWRRLAVWVGSLAVFCVYYATATSALYPTAEDRQNRAASISNPGGVFLSGPGYGTDAYTAGAMFANEMTIWLIVLLAVMNILQITRNTRSEEASGRAELVRALPVGRHAAQVAAFLLVVIADAAFALLGSGLLVAAGLPVADTVAMMAGLLTTALVFAGVATVTCQLTPHPRGASGLAMAALGLALMIRGAGDIVQQHGSPLSWFSPLAWPQQLRAYVDLRVWPLGLSVFAIILTIAIGALLASRRDLGDALLPERAGRSDAAPALSQPFALALRQQRTSLLSWLVGCVAMFGLTGLFVGEGFGDVLRDIADQNDLTAAIFGGDPLAAFLGLMMLHNALAAAVYAIATTLRIKSEEEEGRLGMTLSRPVPRATVLLSHLTVVGLGTFVLVAVGGAVALWIGVFISGGDVSLGTLLTSAGAFSLAIDVMLAFTAALYAWTPRATPLAWTLFAYVVIDTFFGVLLNLPDALRALSPFWWIREYPATPLNPAHLIGLGTAALALIVVAVAGFRRRDLSAG